MRVMFLGYNGNLSVLNIESNDQDTVKRVIDSISGGYTGFDTYITSTPDLKFRFVFNDGIDVKYDYKFALNKCANIMYGIEEYFDCIIFKGIPFTDQVQDLTDEDIEYLYNLYEVNKCK